MEKTYLFNSKNYYTFYPLDDKKRNLVVIAPGGGYDHCSDLEAENVALKFNGEGYHAVVLKYRETLDAYPFPQHLLAYTIDVMRKNPLVDKIISIGFSAGGHLTLSNACYYKEYGYNSRPDALILCYPVISSDPAIAHMHSFEKLLKDDFSDENLDLLSLERHLPSDLAPVFLWHCFTDESVVVNNSLVLLEALKKNKTKTECHIFQEGVHGMSLSDHTTGINNPIKENRYVARWFKMCIDWLNRIF